MPYPYGTQSLPAAVLAPGLPRRQMAIAVGDTLGFPAKVMLVRTNQLIRVPDWATYARMGATGTGGNGSSSMLTSDYGNGGGGGGFAGSNQVKVTPNSIINITFNATGTIIDGLGYRLIGGNGGNATPAYQGNGAGGVGSGGDVNFTGGNGGGGLNTGTCGGGGGAASRGGNGAGGGSPTSSASIGGPGGTGAGYIGGGAGGGCGGLNGVYASGGAVGNPPSTFALGSQLITVGQPGNVGFTMLGGDGGGGGGGQINTSGPNANNTGGLGLAIIEFW